jgi:Ca2+-binding EF-hand superfamily protein
MSQNLKLAVVGAVAMALTSVVVAQDKPAETKAATPEVKAPIAQQTVWQKMDADKDGKLTVAERQARQKEWLKELDANKDSKLSADEFGANRVAILDVNKDGVVTLEEYVMFFVGKDAVTGETVACDNLDANGDGLLTPVEVVAYRKSVFKGMDADNDGKLSSDEVKAGAAKKFTDKDADKDGFVTVEEIVAVVSVPAAAAAPAVAPKADAKKVEEKKADQPAK